MNASLHPSCIYTIRHKDFLDADYASGKSGEFTERGRWAKGRQIFEQPHQSQQRVPARPQTLTLKFEIESILATNPSQT